MSRIHYLRQFNINLKEEAHNFTALKNGEESPFFRVDVTFEEEEGGPYYEDVDELESTFLEDFHSFKLDIEYD